MQRAGIALVLATTFFFPACRKAEAPVQTTSTAAESAAPQASNAAPAIEANAHAVVGEPAPDFALPDLDGNTVRLSEHKGKVVVLEWFNPGCPFVQASHTKGSLAGAAEKASQRGVVWLAINSGAKGQQGTGVETNRDAKARFGMTYPVLLDESGEVGRAYGAKRTPHMFVIDASGKLVYAGAIDNSPDGEGESPTGGRLVHYVFDALEDIAAGRDVRVSRTDAYGCTVKYAAR